MIADLARMARPDHWFKNVFVLPGTALAAVLIGRTPGGWLLDLLVGLVATCLAASANYVVNEWLDAETDRCHPVKRDRPAARGAVRGAHVLGAYVVLAGAALLLSAAVNAQFLVFAVALLLAGLAYNVKPLRTKDRAYLDVIWESANNPIRLLLGWSVVAPGALPPSSLVVSYWMGGAFLMGVKRHAERRTLGDAAVAAAYRRSFAGYGENALLLSSFFYALSSVFFLGIFLIKYRIEFLLTFPLFALLFTWYLGLGLRADSPAQAPERLYREKAFVAYVALLVACVVALVFVDLPWLRWLLEVSTY